MTIYREVLIVHLPKLPIPYSLFPIPYLLEDFIKHPKLIIEVLSDSTEAFDRGEKFADYKTIAEFEEYILIHQKQMLVEQFQRKSGNLWVPQIYRAGDTIKLASIGFSCAIATLYENIEQLL
ncbi:MAG: Uma2 family endonuclease [Symploca sp. SIO1A3]|nr:Uma2 family endonuclease [Symploca sp. SIO1A3]